MGRPAPLVRDYLFIGSSHDAHDKLTAYGLEIAMGWSKDDLPRFGIEVVYALVADGIVHWVGRTNSIRTRISTHKSNGVRFHQVYMTICDSRVAGNILECRMINQLRPRGNDKIPVLWLAD